MLAVINSEQYLDLSICQISAKGIWFHLYALIDIYSRYSPGYLVSVAEDSIVAAGAWRAARPSVGRCRASGIAPRLIVPWEYCT